MRNDLVLGKTPFTVQSMSTVNPDPIISETLSYPLCCVFDIYPDLFPL
jgi:hypothetical protein